MPKSPRPEPRQAPEEVIKTLEALIQADPGNALFERIAEVLPLAQEMQTRREQVRVPPTLEGEIVPLTGSWPTWGDEWLREYRVMGLEVHACRAVKIGHATLKSWIARSPAFAMAVKEADAEVEALYEGRLRALAFAGDRLAILAVLRSLNPARWGDTTGARSLPEPPRAASQSSEVIYEIRERLYQRLLSSSLPAAEDRLPPEPE